MIEPFDRSLWTGRDDSLETGDVRRLFQIVEGASSENVPGQSAILLGFACDAGVARNKGRTGSALGPKVIRKVLAGFPAHHFEKYTTAGMSCV